ncbi:hypothetical protein MBLNU457_7735t1 [Dothideomycetes sp. NU457]
MRVAELLSDLTSLRACDPSAAQALVSHRPADPSTEGNTNDSLQRQASRETDVDLKRAEDLIELHSTVKVAPRNGVDTELLVAREQVRRVLAEI